MFLHLTTLSKLASKKECFLEILTKQVSILSKVSLLEQVMLAKN
jgi:hypothetical protein